MNDEDRYNIFQPPQERPPTHPTVTPAPGTTHADIEMRSRVPYAHEDIFSAPGYVEVLSAPRRQLSVDLVALSLNFVAPGADSAAEMLAALKRGEEVDRVSRDARKSAQSASDWENLTVSPQQRDLRGGLGRGLSATENKDMLRDSARALGEDFDPRSKVGPKGGQAGKSRTQKKDAAVNKPGSTISARGKIRRKPRLSAPAPDVDGRVGNEVAVRYVDPKKKEN